MKYGFATNAIHAGQEPDKVTGAIMTPISMSSTFKQVSLGVHIGYEYSRSGNPTRKAFEDCVARIDLYRLRQAKQASAAALTEPEVQEDVSAALEEALQLKARHGNALALDTADSDDRTLALASALVEDDEMGRRLHHTPQSARQQDTTQGEGDQ